MHSVSPAKIICIGRNYVAHIEELGSEMPDEMVVFMKPGSARTDQLCAFHQEPLHYECELCIEIRSGQIAAIGLGLDLTKRELQDKLRKKGLPWERCKAFVGSALFSDFVEATEISPELRFELLVDGKVRQQGLPDLMIYKVDQIISELSRFMDLQDGDVIMTGTPAGVGEIQAGECFELNLFDGNELLVSRSWKAS